MKRFQFSLETVLDYKKNILDSLQVEYGMLLSRVRMQEDALAAARARYLDTNKEFREKKLSGLTIAGMLSYEVGFQVIEQNIQSEEAKLVALREQEVELHARLVASKVDTSSLSLLREKKLSQYDYVVRKQEEHTIDELLNFARIVSPAMPRF